MHGPIVGILFSFHHNVIFAHIPGRRKPNSTLRCNSAEAQNRCQGCDRRCAPEAAKSACAARRRLRAPAYRKGDMILKRAENWHYNPAGGKMA